MSEPIVVLNIADRIDAAAFKKQIHAAPGAVFLKRKITVKQNLRLLRIERRRPAFQIYMRGQVRIANIAEQIAFLLRAVPHGFFEVGGEQSFVLNRKPPDRKKRGDSGQHDNRYNDAADQFRGKR